MVRPIRSPNPIPIKAPTNNIPSSSAASLVPSVSLVMCWYHSVSVNFDCLALAVLDLR